MSSSERSATSASLASLVRMKSGPRRWSNTNRGPYQKESGLPMAYFNPTDRRLGTAPFAVANPCEQIVRRRNG